MTRYAFAEFVERLTHQVPDCSVNSIRYFGSPAPRIVGRSDDFIFYLLSQR